MRTLLLLLLSPLAAFSLTQISDTVYTATGDKAQAGSYFIVTWPRFTTSGSRSVLPNSLRVNLVDGSFSIALEPTTTATFPFRYNVEYHLSSRSGSIPVYTEVWSVPDTAVPQTLASVAVTTTPVASAAPPMMKGDLSTSDGVGPVRLPAPAVAGQVLQTDPTQPTGLTYGPPPGNFDPAGAAAAAQQNAVAAAEASAAAMIAGLGLESASQHQASDFDPAGTAASAQTAANSYTDTAIAALSLTPGPPGPAGANGESAYQLAVDGGFAGTFTDWLASLQGAVGIQGPQGVAGAQGPKGATGVTGAQGPAGPTGPAGAVGPAGATGPGGATGPVGATGPAGAPGPTGATGAQGPGGPAGTAATVSVGTVSALAAGATPTVTNSGTGSAAVLSFGIPAGAQGPAGTVTTLYGPYSSLPSTCTSGATYTMTSGLFDNAICTATNTWTFSYGHRPITPAAKLAPTSGGASSTVTTTNANGYELMTAPPGGSSNISLRYFTAPAQAPYTAVLAIKMPIFIDTANYRELFLGWFDPSVGYQGLNCGTGTGSFGTTASCRISTFSTTGAFIATQFAATAPVAGLAAVQYVKLSNDGTNLSISLCSDWDNCQAFGSVPASTFFTGGLPTRLAWGMQNSTASSNTATNFTVIGLM